MRVVDLDPSFVVPVHAEEYHLVDQIEGARGVTFQCPACVRQRPDGVGVHYVLCWNGLVPDDWQPGPGRWEMVGTGYADLTLRGWEGASSSVAITSGCRAHFFVRDGAIEFC